MAANFAYRTLGTRFAPPARHLPELMPRDRQHNPDANAARIVRESTSGGPTPSQPI